MKTSLLAVALLSMLGCSGITPWLDETDASVDASVDAAVMDSGVDAGPMDAGSDAGPADAGSDAGVDAGVDAGFDAGFDAGCTPVSVPSASLQGASKFRDLAFDADGRLYVLAQLPMPHVLVLGPAPTFTPLARFGGGRLAVADDFDLGPSGDLWVVDGATANRRITQYALDGGITSTFDAGSNVLTVSERVDGGLVLGSVGGRMEWSQPDGTQRTTLALPSLAITHSNDQRRAANGTVWHADFGYHRVVRFDVTSGAELGRFGMKGAGPGQFDGAEQLVASPSRLAVDSKGRVFADDYYARRVQWFTPGGVYGGELAVSSTVYPYALAVEPGTDRLAIGTGDSLELRCSP